MIYWLRKARYATSTKSHIYVIISLPSGEAITAGVKLRGYFVWSLLDNFEWEEGYSRRFGVIYVDFKTLKRAPKASYQWLTQFIKTNSHQKQR